MNHDLTPETDREKRSRATIKLLSHMHTHIASLLQYSLRLHAGALAAPTHEAALKVHDTLWDTLHPQLAETAEIMSRSTTLLAQSTHADAELAEIMSCLENKHARALSPTSPSCHAHAHPNLELADATTLPAFDGCACAEETSVPLTLAEYVRNDELDLPMVLDDCDSKATVDDDLHSTGRKPKPCIGDVVREVYHLMSHGGTSLLSQVEEVNLSLCHLGVRELPAVAHLLHLLPACVSINLSDNDFEVEALLTSIEEFTLNCPSRVSKINLSSLPPSPALTTIRLHLQTQGIQLQLL